MKKEFFWADPSNLWAFPMAKAGLPFIIASSFVTFVFALLRLPCLTTLSLIVTFFICFFFRDPDRVIPNVDNAIVSPADGKILLAQQVPDNPFIDGSCVKISIFMSVFNAHINRIPFDGKVEQIIYNPGKFFSANLDKASKSNESNAVILDTGNGKKICFVQIAGLIARRIICKIQEGENVKKGSRFGLICFGSRLDVYLPSDVKINVKPGDKVKSGTDILAYMN